MVYALRGGSWCRTLGSALSVRLELSCAMTDPGPLFVVFGDTRDRHRRGLSDGRSLGTYGWPRLGRGFVGQAKRSP